MKLYLIAIVITLAATFVIVNACIFHASSLQAVPINLFQLK